MIERLARLGRSGWYWAGLLLLGLALEGVALFYQYQLDYAPCVLCIHVRIWVLGMIVVAAFALWQRHSRYALLAGHGLTTLLMVGMVERSYQLLGTERGWFFGSCNMDAGLPGWFALDRWFPAIFEVKEACGYTPLLPLGVSMAEALMAFSVAMVTVAALLLLLEGWRLRQR